MIRALVARPADHLLLGVEWSGMTVTGGGAALVADPGGGVLTLWFPPQHLAEETIAETAGAAGRRRARLSGSSALRFVVPAGNRVELTVEGLVRAAGELAVDAGSVVELPWRLKVRPQAHGGQPLRAGHPVGAIPDETNPLWRTRLHASEPGSGVELVVVDATAAGIGDPPDFVPALDRFARQSLADLTRKAPARSSLFELSALGGSLVASGRWPEAEWDHSAVLGRDMSVRFLARGYLYPFGHRAVYEKSVVRAFDAAEQVAVLRHAYQLTVVEPVRGRSEDPAIRRRFPFDEVEISRTVFTELEHPDWQSFDAGDGQRRDTYFRPMASAGRPLLFPVACHAPNGPVRLEVPLVFVADRSLGTAATSRLAEELGRFYGRVTVAIPPTPLDLVRAPEAAPADVHLVRGLTLGGRFGRADPGAVLEELEMTLPALGRLLDQADTYHPFRYTDAFAEQGESAYAMLELAAGEAIPIDFAGRAERSGGLAALAYRVNAISRDYGPVKAAAGALVSSPAGLFDVGAGLLGYPLREIIERIDVPPMITAEMRPGRGPVVTMSWSQPGAVTFRKNLPGFVAKDTTRLELNVVASDTGTSATCTLHDFGLRLPTSDPLLELSFAKVTYVRRTGPEPPGQGTAPDGLTVEGLGAKLLGGLRLLEELGDNVAIGDAGPKITPSTSGVAVDYALPLPAVTCGVFVMRNMLFRAGVDVSFTGAPPEVVLGFSDRTNPFVLTVMAFGGGGYLELAADQNGLRRLEAALEFGALVAVEFYVARGEAHILGGVRFVWDSGELEVSGYLRIGGTLDVLGLVSVSVELRLELTYRSATNDLVGRATVILEIEVLFWSERVELDSGEWRLVGGDAPAPTPPAAFAALTADGDHDPGLENWRRYRSRFAPAPSEEEP